MGWLESQKCCVKEGDFENVLGIEENFVIIEGAGEATVPLKEPV